MALHLEHPSCFLPHTLTHRLRQLADEAERLEQLHNEQLAIIYEQQWFNMLVPKEYGGLEFPLPLAIQTQEALSYADGSVGWVVTLCSGAGWFAGFLDPTLAKEVFKNPKACIAGSGAITGTANLSGSRYEINGYWKYASGALHATAFTANCLVKNEGLQLYHSDGAPIVHTFLLKSEDVRIHKRWNAMGMIATASHAFEAHGLWVPQNQCFSIDATRAINKHPLFQYPFLQLAETTLAANISGMAARFLDLTFIQGEQKAKRCSGKPPEVVQHTIDAQGQLNSLRNDFYEKVQASWEVLTKEGQIEDALLLEVSQASQRLVKGSRLLINKLFPFGGLEAADRRSEINRVWRNIHTAGQHALFNPAAVC